MQVLGRVWRQGVRDSKGRVYYVHYITLDSTMRRHPIFKEAIARGAITIKLFNNVITTRVRSIGKSWYIHIPRFIVEKHPELRSIDHVEFEVVE